VRWQSASGDTAFDLSRGRVRHKSGVALRFPPHSICVLGWFERTATPAQVKTIYALKTDHLSVPDDFDVSPDW
jgi:hypothetical protein